MPAKWLLISLLTVAAISFFAVATRGGTVATDGSLGPRTTLSGPNFSIGPNLGQQRGGNLFHSFSAFDLTAGETATFTGPASVQYVFARVTGGQPSSIDGTLRCTIPNASFYLINPSGVMFGPDAALDVKGSFAVTTADTIKLGAAGSFNATHPSASSLTTAAPGAFGFLAASPAGVSIQGTASSPSRLAVQPGKGLSVVSGPIQIVHGQLIAPGGQANLVAVASPGQATFNAADPQATPGVSTFAAFSGISVTQRSQISLDGTAGGGYYVHGATITVDASAIVSTTLGNLRGFDGVVIASRTVSLTDAASITTNLDGPGQGGGLTVTAHDLVLDGSGGSRPPLLGVQAAGHATGQAGVLTVRAKMVSVLAGAEIDASTSGRGQAGDLNLTASTLTLDDRGDLNPTVNATGLFAESDSSAHGAGAAGDLTVHAATVQVLAGAEISSDTFGPGHGGTLSLTATSLTLDDHGNLAPSVNPTGLLADSLSTAHGAGAAGDLSVHAGTVQVLSGAEISDGTFGPGVGGDMSVTATSLTLDDRGNIDPSVNVTGIFAHSNSSADGAGAAGELTVQAGTVRVLAGAEIDSSTFGPGRGGNVSLTANSLTLDDRGDLDPSEGDTGVFAESDSSAQGAGAAGELTVQAATVLVLAGAEI